MEGAEEEDNEDGLLDYDSNEEDEAMDTGVRKIGLTTVLNIG